MNENAERDVTDHLLRHLAVDNENAVVRELADQVLQGSISLAEGMNSAAYADGLTPGLDGFT